MQQQQQQSSAAAASGCAGPTHREHPLSPSPAWPLCCMPHIRPVTALPVGGARCACSHDISVCSMNQDLLSAPTNSVPLRLMPHALQRKRCIGHSGANRTSQSTGRKATS